MYACTNCITPYQRGFFAIIWSYVIKLMQLSGVDCSYYIKATVLLGISLTSVNDSLSTRVSVRTDVRWERNNLSHIFSCSRRRITPEYQQWPKFMLSPPLSTINWCTMGIRLNIHWIVSAGKSSHASSTVLARVSVSYQLSRCLHSTADCKLIRMPRSRVFTSGEHAGWNLIVTLCSFLNPLVHYSIAALVPFPPALSRIR
jgi:hypothetical protein